MEVLVRYNSGHVHYYVYISLDYSIGEQQKLTRNNKISYLYDLDKLVKEQLRTNPKITRKPKCIRVVNLQEYLNK